MLLTQTAAADYEQLCKLDVLGIQDTTIGDQADVYEEFKEQLTRSAEGWYETGLPWKGNHPLLPNNKTGSLKRLEHTVQKLENQGLLEQYDAIIKEQLVEGIVEPAKEQVVFYIPHKPVIRESTESTVPLKSKLPPLVSFLARQESRLERRDSRFARTIEAYILA